MSLADDARLTSTPFAAVMGIAACCAQTTAPIAAIIGSVGEPYRSLGEYISKTLVAAPFILLPLAVVWGGVFLLMHISRYERNSGRSIVLLRAAMLSPVVVLLPGLFWSLCATARVYASPANNLIWPATKPAWLTSSAIRIAGSSMWLIVLAALAGFAYILARHRIDRVIAGSVCEHCLYDLTGNESGVCPECGAPVPSAS